jgi:hypothetical protein
VEAAGEEARAVQRPEVGDFLDDAEQARVAARVRADRAGIDRVDIAADRADGEALVHPLQGAEQRRHRRLALLHQMQDRAAGGAWPEAGKPRERLRRASISGEAMGGR